MKNFFTPLIKACSVLVTISLLSITIVSAQYCEFSGSNPSADHITNVTFAGINNTSLATGYSDFTSMSAIVSPGISYPISAIMGNGGTWTETLTVYIDWDQNEIFDASERYNFGSCTSGGCATPLSGSIEVPMTAVPGETRMRVIGKFSSAPVGPCTADGIMTYGEVEDYTVNVQSGICTPPSFTYTIENDCEGGNYDVTALLSDFGTSSFITVYLTRSDAVPVNPVTLIFALQGETVNIINDVPFGVTVSATISGSNPICDLTKNWAELYCHIPGEVCEAPLVVSSLPFTASGNTATYLDDYAAADVPPLAPNAITTGSTGNYYLDGDDVVFAYTPDEDGAIDISTTNGTYTSLYVFTGCPFASTLGYHNASPAGTRAIDHLPVLAGTTYYIVISTWPSPQSTDFTLSINPWEDCTGTPSAGTVGEDIMVCAATAFELISTDVSIDANGLTFTWQSSPAGANEWADVEGANETTYNLAAGITADTDFRLKAYCLASDATDYSDVLSVTLNPAYNECYCIPSGSSNNADEILNFTLGTINNTSAPSEGIAGYADYTDTIAAADLIPGELYVASLTSNTGSGNHGAAIWIDYNDNGAFEASEKVTLIPNSIPSNSTVSFPAFEVMNMPGLHRLRVQYRYNTAGAALDPCVASTFTDTEDYMVNIIELGACSGTPDGGTADESEINICANIAFELSVSDASDVSGGLTRNWQSSPAGLNTWTDIDGASSTTYTVAGGVDVPTDFRYRVVCTNSNQSDVSNVVQVNLNPAIECYCIPTNSYSTSYFISNVSTDGALQDLDRTSGFTAGGYADYTATDTLITHANQEFDFSVSWPSSTYNVGVWVDFNQNGSFGDADEQIILSGFGSSPYTGTIEVPDGLPDGSYRMRVRANYIGTPAACGDDNYAEAEDYIVKVITLNECSGTPDAGTIAGGSFEICPNQTFTLLVEGSSSPANGLTKNWQSSPAGTNTWTDIPEETSASYTVDGGITVATDYRYRVTCTNSNQTDYSNVIQGSINTNVTDCYCIPTGTNASYYINNFSTSNGVANISNLTSGFSAGGYGDFTSMTVSQVQTQSVNFTEDFVGGTAGFRIWVDWNQDGAFDIVTELAYNSTSYSASHSGSFEVPQSALAGTTRMRVVAHYLSTTGLIDPCGTFTYGEFEDYNFNVIPLETCTGTPSAGVADNDEFVICATAPITLSVTGASEPATGLVRNWQSSPAGANTWTNIDGATSTTYVLAGGISEATDFRYVVTCELSSETAYSNIVEATINTNVIECYCIPAGTNSTYYINNFSTTNGISNISNLASGFSTGGYGDFTSQTVSQVQTQSVSFADDFIGGSAGFRIWVDWNQDGAFEPVTEVVYNSTAYANSHSGSFTVPQSALPGTTRMRVVGHYLSSTGLIDPCASFTYGEFEDYTFEVIALEACTGTPSPGVASVGQLNVCPNSPITLSVSGASEPATGLVRNWQSSPAGANTWTNIAGATENTFVLADGIDVATDFRYVVTCELSSETAYSNVVETTINTVITECYCIPEGITSTRFINNFSTTGAIQNVTNNGSGFSAGGYGDFTSMTVEQANEETVNFSVDILGGTAGFRIWVDWNQDGQFDVVNEVVYNSSSYSAAHSGSFTVPAGAASGTTRMRIVSHWLSSAGLIDPCVTAFTYGEFEDYTFVVSSGSAVSLNGSVTWNSSCGNRAGTVKLYTPNTATLLETYNITVGTTGAFSIENLPAGTYDVIVKVDGYLAKGVQDVVVAAGVNTLAVGTIRNGNVNNDGAVNFFDLSLINSSYNKSSTQTGYNPLADLNCDGIVNFFDISIMNSSFNKVGATAPL